MADDLQIVSDMLGDFVDDKVKGLLDKKEWMEKCSFTMVRDRESFTALVDDLVKKGLCAVDLETTSLNTRVDESGNSIAKIVGICLAKSATEGWYVPTWHEDKEYNLPYDFAIRELSRLVKNCRCIFHNFKYDGQVMHNHGIVITNEEMIEDTFLMAGVADASSKERGLKVLSEKLLDRPMIPIEKLGLRSGKNDVLRFDLVPPQIALYYGAGDAINTFALFEYLSSELDRQDPDQKSGPWIVYRKIEKRCLFPVMQMERNLCKIDIDYLVDLKTKLENKKQTLLRSILELAGRDVDINSPKQLGTLLFEEMRIQYPEKERTASGQYMTGEDTLQKLSDVPIVGMILQFRAIEKIVGTYIDNFIKNVDERGFVKFQLNQLQADTGRFSASGGKGIKEDGYCGVNCQNIPVPDDEDPEAPDIRRAIIARPGYKIVAIDYSGEELRIAANFSKEPKWIDEFLRGTADLHTMTAKIIHSKNEVNKKERNLGKRINFLTLYGGGAAGFAAQCGIPYDQAKRMIINFFRGYSTLKRWIDAEIKASRKRGYSVTAFGRRRPLDEFYKATDEKIKAKGDRCAVNSRIQGCLQPHVRCLTTEGYIPISELSSTSSLRKSIRVWTGVSWENFKVLNRGPCQTAQIELENGMVLDCDTRHEVLVATPFGYDFVKFSDLKDGDDVCISYPRPIEFGRYPEKQVFSGRDAHNSVDLCVCTERDWNFIAYLMGVIVAVGNVCANKDQSVMIDFGQKKVDKIYRFLRDGLSHLGLNLTKPIRCRGARGVNYRSHVSSKALIDMLAYLGCSFGGAQSRRVPEFIFRAPMSMRRAFIKGYHDTNECKKDANKCCFHTPNGMLLKDLQIIAWTLGIPSALRKNAGGTYVLSWCALSSVERLFDIPSRSRKRLTCVEAPLPRFLYHTVYESLKLDGRYVKNKRDRALVCKLKTGKKVLLSTALNLLRKYECSLPDVYYTSKVASKKVNSEVVETYTLSVESPLHRFDSSCIISKNTGADIIKMALYKVWKWILDNGYGEDVRMLMPVHDEVVFEIKEDKLDFYIPEICNIMRLKDIIDALGWEVPLEVDAEYGDNFHVDHDYWKERTSSEKKTTETATSSVNDHNESPAKPIDDTNSRIEHEVSVIEVPMQQSNLTTNTGEIIHFNVTVREAAMTASEKAKTRLEASESEPPDEALKDVRIKDRIDHRGVLIYPIERLDHITLHQFETVIRILMNYGDALFIGPRCRVALVDKSTGEVWYESTRKVSVDAFLALCFWLKI